MVYTLKLDGESIGEVIRVVDRVSNDPDLGLVSDLNITFAKKASYDTLMDKARALAAESKNYVLTVEDDNGEVIYNTEHYHSLKEAQIVIAPGEQQEFTFYWVME